MAPRRTLALPGWARGLVWGPQGGLRGLVLGSEVLSAHLLLLLHNKIEPLRFPNGTGYLFVLLLRWLLLFIVVSCTYDLCLVCVVLDLFSCFVHVAFVLCAVVCSILFVLALIFFVVVVCVLFRWLFCVLLYCVFVYVFCFLFFH